MALLTPLPFDDARALLSAYGLELTRLVPLRAGSVNSNFLLETAEGRPLFARIYEEQGPEGARFELSLNEALAQAGVPVALPVRRLDGAQFAMVGDKPFAVYERARGEVLCQARVTPQVTRALGAALARVHLADLGGLVVPEGRFDRAALLGRLETVERSGRAALLAGASRVRALLERLDRERSTELPRGLIHGDLFRDNALVSGDGISALLDFESACAGSYVYDVAVTLLAWCYGDRLDAELAFALLDGYHAVRPLSALEQASLPSEGAFACARFATTRMTDFSLRVGEHETPGRDFRRFFQRLDELDQGALSPLLARLPKR
ncbi:MAG TPA: homoserine kinase [Polyangiaceae bacterium]|nr:homoserine kinase [Polyangiaceae bacterium]